VKPFHLEIVTPDGAAFDGMAESLLVRTTEGDVEILASHADYLATVATGRTRIVIDGEEKFASSQGGFLSVTKGDVKLVATTFEFAEKIDLERAKAARDRAEEALSRAKNARDIELAKARLSRALNRINVAGMK
jgi:F-type H+-transporting ATPase subunit epsilon